MEERVPLAKQLRAMKEHDIAQAGLALTAKILAFTKIRYSKSEVVFRFKSSWCFAKTPARMEVPQPLRKKLKALESEQAEMLALEEWEKLLVEIVEDFNAIENSVMLNDNFSSEQAAILEVVRERLTAECFKVSITDRQLYIGWWGE